MGIQQLWNFLWILLFIAGGIELLGAIGLRFYVRTSPEVRFRRVAPEDAEVIVTDFVDGYAETRLGFPTGFFSSKGRTPDGSIVFDELRSSSMGWRATGTVIMVPLSIGMSIGLFIGGLFDSPTETQSEGCLGRIVGVLIGGAVGLVIALFLFPLVLGATVLEVSLKYLATSRIEATTRVAGDEPLDTLVTFKFRGACALLSERSILAGFSAPVLSPRLAAFSAAIPPAEVEPS